MGKKLAILSYMSEKCKLMHIKKKKNIKLYASNNGL